MPSTTQFEIDELSPQARDTYHQTLRDFQDYGPPPDDHHCFGAREHHTRYNFEDADRFQAYTKALDLRFEEPGSQGATRGTVRTAPEVDTVQGHYGIYRIVDQVHNARIAQACHPGLRGMEFIEIDISDELYFGDILAVKTLAFNPGYFPRPSGSSVLPYHRTTATLPGDHCRWSAREYLVFRRDIRTSQALLRVDDRVGVIEGFSGLTRLPSSFHTGRVYLGDVFYPEHLEIRGLTPILTHLPTILRHWKSRCAVPESLRALADSADLQNTRFDHRMFQHRVNICRDELIVNCSADWLEGSRVLVSFLDRDIEAVLVKSCNGDLTFQLSERYSGPSWVPVMVQQLGFQGAPFRERPQSREGSRRSSEAGFEGYRGNFGDRGDLGDRGDRGRSRSPSEERYSQPLVGVYDPEPNPGSPEFEERYGRDEGRGREPEGSWDRQGQWDGLPGQESRFSRQGYRPGSPEGNWGRQGQGGSPAGHATRDSRQDYRPGSPEQRNWSPGPRQWDRNNPSSQWNDSPRDYPPKNQFSQPQGSRDAQFRRPESEQYQNDRQQPSEYRNQHQQFLEPQYSPQSAQFYPSQPEDRPNDSQYPFRQSGHLQDRSLHHNPLEGRYNDSPCSSERSLTLDQYNAQNYQNYQREKRQSWAEGPQYPSEYRGQPQDHFKPQYSPQGAQYYDSQSNDASWNPSDRPGHPQDRFETSNSSQNRPFYRDPPGGRQDYVNNPQYPSEYRDQPQNHSNSQLGPQGAQSYHTDYPVIQTEQSNHRQDPQTTHGYRNQAQDRSDNSSRYPSDHQGLFQPQHGSHNGQSYGNQSHDRPDDASRYPSEYRSQPQHSSNPQFSPQGAQSYRSQPDDRYSSDNEPRYPSNQPGLPLETPILSQNRPVYRDQPRDRSFYANDAQYPSEHRSQSQNHFKPQFSPQNDYNQSSGRPQYPLSPSGPSNGSQYLHNQSEDRQTLPRSLSPRVSTLSPSGDPIIRHSQSRSSISQASSVSGDHFEQPNQGPAAPRASCSSGQAQSSQPRSPQGHPVRNPLSYHSNQPQGHQPSPNQVPSTSRAAGYSDGLSPTGQSYYQGYATSSDGSEEDSSSESEPEVLPRVVQKQGYNALYSHFPSSSGQKPIDRYSPRVPDLEGDPQGAPSLSSPREPGQPGSSSIPEPVEPVEPPKPARAETPPFDPHNSRSWRHEHKDDICEVVEPKEPVNQGQGGSRASQQPSQPARECPELSEPSYRPSMDRRDSKGIHEPSRPVRENLDQEPSQSNSGRRSSVDYRTSRDSLRPNHPVEDHWDPQTSFRSSTDRKGSQASYHSVKDHLHSKPSRSSPDRKDSQISHQSADPKWPSEPENSAPEEDQHPEPLSRDHPYLPALLKHQLLVVDALNPELHIASAAASLAKTDWSLKTRGLKQRGTQVIVCKDPDAPRITGMLLDALESPETSGLRLMRFTGETLLKIDFDRCLARKLRGILREPGAWDQRIVLQAARYLTHDPLTPKLENLLRNNSHIPEMPMEEWVAWYMERWVPDVLLSTSEYLEIGTKYLRRVESVQVLGEVSEEHGRLTARFPKAKIAVIGDVLGPATGPRHPETVEILKEAFSGLQGSQLMSLRSEAPFLRPPGPDYLKIRSGIFPNPKFPILLIHNTSTKGTKEQRNLQERKALDELVKGLLGLETDQTIPPEDLQIICIEKNQVRDLRVISTPGIQIRSRQEASEGAPGVLTHPEGSPSPRAPEEDDSAPQDHPQITPIAIICCSNYKKSAFELIRAQLPQLLSYGTQATIFIGNIDEMEQAEGWGALVARCEEVGCSYSYQMVPEERSWKYQPTKRDHKGFMGPLPEYGSSRGSSSECGGFQSPKSGSSGSGSPRSVTRGSENLIFGSGESSESFRTEPVEFKPLETEQEACEPKSEESEPSKTEFEACEPKPDKLEACEPKIEESELSEPKSEEPEPSETEPEEPESFEPEQKVSEPKFGEPEPSSPKPEESEPSEPEHNVSEPKVEESQQSASIPEEPELTEPSEPKPEESEPSEPEPLTSGPKTEEPELSEPKSEQPDPSKTELEACEPKSKEPEPSETEQVASEPEPEESELFEPKHEEPEPSEAEPKVSEPSDPEHKAAEPKFEEPAPLEPEHKACEPKFEESESSKPEPVTSEPSEPKPEPSGLKAREPEPSGLEPKAREPKYEEPEPSEPELEVFEPRQETSEPKPEEPEPSELKSEETELFEENKSPETEPATSEPSEPSGPGSEVCEPKSGKSEPSEPELEACEPEPKKPEPELKEPEQSDLKTDASDPTSPILTLEHLDLAITATVSPTLSPAIPRKSCSPTPEKDFTTPDCLLENLTLEDLEPSDQEYEDCEEEFQDAPEAENQDSDTGTYESTYSDHQETTGLSTIEEALTGHEESD